MGVPIVIRPFKIVSISPGMEVTLGIGLQITPEEAQGGGVFMVPLVSA